MRVCATRRKSAIELNVDRSMLALISESMADKRQSSTTNISHPFVEEIDFNEIEHLQVIPFSSKAYGQSYVSNNISDCWKGCFRDGVQSTMAKQFRGCQIHRTGIRTKRFHYWGNWRTLQFTVHDFIESTTWHRFVSYLVWHIQI